MPSDHAARFAKTGKSLINNVALRQISIAQSMTLIATYSLLFTTIALVEEKTQSSMHMGLMVFGLVLPGYLFGMIAGGLVDRFDRRRALIAGNLLCLLVSVGYSAGTHWLDSLPQLLLTIYLTNFMLSALLQFTASARDSLLPDVVLPEQLLTTNSIIQVAMFAAQGVGAVFLAPLMLRLGGAPTAGVAASLCFAFAAWEYSRLSIRRVVRAGDAPQKEIGGSVLADLRAGWGFVSKNAMVRYATMTLMLISGLILVLMVLLPGLASRLWNVSMEKVLFLAIPGGLGFAMGLWLLGRRGRTIREDTWICTGLITLGTGLALIPTLRVIQGWNFLLYSLISMGTGMGFALVIIPARTIVQDRPPDEIRGRVVSTQLFLSNTASTLPLPLVGGLADTVGIRNVFSILALIVLTVGVLSIRRTRRKVKIGVDV